LPSIQEILIAAAELHRRRDLADAERAYRQVLQLDAGNVDAHHLLGVLLFETGRTDEALPEFDRALKINPNFANAHYNLGRALAELGRFNESIVAYRRAIEHQPDFTHAHYNLGNLFTQLRRQDEAIQCFRRAIASDPNYPKAYTNLGHLLLKREDPEATACFEKAAALEPNSITGLLNLSKALRQKGDLVSAEKSIDRALTLDAECAGAFSELGMIRREQAKLDDALTMLHKANRLQPNDSEILSNLALVYMALEQFEETIAMFKRAIEINPDFSEARLNLGITYLLTGDLDRGWPQYDYRYRSKLEPTQRPRWDGGTLSGKTILLYPEQGMGDSIQFIRFGALLKERDARVLFGCPESLLRLFKTCPGIDLVLPDRSPLPPFDCHARLLSLPGLLGINLSNIPATVPYLFPPNELVEAWGARLAHLDGFKVGIAWQGNPKHKGDRQRSVKLAQFEPLSRIDGVRLVSLQQGFGVEQIAQAGGNVQIYDPGPLGDFLESAAVIRNLDLVITVDSAIAHLAGALGVATWVALPRAPDWRWMLGREDSPWYPSMRLFRQERAGEWEPMFAKIVHSIKTLAR
jgi:tetratricopeptide (TPR) repeat protein